MPRYTLTLGLLAFAGTPALADVMELDQGTARWVAGGPSQGKEDVDLIPPMPMPSQIDRQYGQLPDDVNTTRSFLLPIQKAVVTSRFGYRNHPILSGQRMHWGLDLAAPVGTPVYATASGIVNQAGWAGSYGLLVELAHTNEVQTRYGHLSQLAVAAGQRVAPGEVVGYVGSTGRSTDPHLHYEVRVRGTAVDPLQYINN
jgi:murein DD-endopeptidase MepM/ murein hydrolase activator NlpD